MKKIILISVLFFFEFQLSAQTTLVTICPHYNGIENVIGWADSTNPSWPGSPAQYDDTAVGDSSVIIEYMSWTSSGCPFDVRFLLNFADITNTAVIPAHSAILSATLYLYGVPSTPTGDFGNSVFPGSPYLPNLNDGWLYELASPYNTNTVTWNNQPDVKHTDSVYIPPSATRWSDNDVLDVTSLVTDLIATGNTGFEFRLQTENLPYSERLYASSRYSDSTLHPALQVVYVDTSDGGTAAVRSINNLTADLSIYPNPVQTQLSAYVTVSNNTTMSVSISNIVGQTIFASQQNFHEGVNTLKIPVNDLAPGIYILETYNQSTDLKQRFVKQ